MDDQSLHARIRVAEAMLEKYIRERKKPLAEMALATLSELAPSHRRLTDYQSWVAEIDREAAAEMRVRMVLVGGREALQAGDIATARRRLATLGKLDPDGEAAAKLADEIAQSELEQRHGNDIEQSKLRIDELLASGMIDDAEREVQGLASHGVAKLTRDFLNRRIAAVRRQQLERGRAEEWKRELETHLAGHRWQQARDIAHQMGAVEPAVAAELFEHVNRAEAAHGRTEAIDQGITTLERFIAQGRRSEAQMTLKVLRGLDVDERQIRLFNQRIARL